MINYVNIKYHTGSRVKGLIIKDKPEESGFDFHHLYSRRFSLDPKKKEANKFNRLPYRQSS